MVCGGIAFAELLIASGGTTGDAQKEEESNDMFHAMVPEYPNREEICLEYWRNLANPLAIVNKSKG
jgi:hypothetical protein